MNPIKIFIWPILYGIYISFGSITLTLTLTLLYKELSHMNFLYMGQILWFILYGSITFTPTLTPLCKELLMI